MTYCCKYKSFQLALTIIALLIVESGSINGKTNEIAYLELPTNVSAQLGQTITLTCKFNIPVICLWKRGESPKLDIEGRYRYIDGNNGNSEDCSIEIANIKQIDFASWMCTTTETELQQQRDSQPIKITEQILVDIITDQNRTVIEQRGALHRILLKADEEGVITCDIANHQSDATAYLWEHRNSEKEKWQVFHHGDQTPAIGILDRCRCSAVIGGLRIYSAEYIVVPNYQENLVCETEATSGYTILGLILGITFVAAIVVGLLFCFRKNVIPTIRRILNSSSDIKCDVQSIQKVEITNTGDIVENGEHEDDPARPVRRSQSIIDFSYPVHSSSSPNNEDESGQEKTKLLLEPKHSNGPYRIKNKEITFKKWPVKKYSYLKKIEYRTTDQNNPGKSFQHCEFNINGTELKMKVYLFLNGFIRGYGTHLSVLFELLPKNKFQSNGPVFYHKRTLRILDQSDVPEEQKRHIYFDYEPTFKSGLTQKWMKEKWGRHRLVRQNIIDQEGSVYVKDDAIKMEILIEPVDLLEDRIVCNDGFLIWQISNYILRKEDEKIGLFECLRSNDFLCEGYRCKVVLYLNGKGKGYDKDCSIYLGFLNSENSDNSSTATFAHRATFAILDQSNIVNGKHFSRTDNLNPKDVGNSEGEKRMAEFSIGSDRFSKFEEYEKPPYLLNNEIYIAVMVEKLNGNDDPMASLRKRLQKYRNSKFSKN